MLAIAGLWERWRAPSGEPLETCVIVTTEANATLAPIHDRMPVILDRDAEAGWLDPEASPQELRDLLVPTDELLVTEVSDVVNDVREDGPALIEPPLRLF